MWPKQSEKWGKKWEQRHDRVWCGFPSLGWLLPTNQLLNYCKVFIFVKDNLDLFVLWSFICTMVNHHDINQQFGEYLLLFPSIKQSQVQASRFLCFNRTWGDDPIWLIFRKFIPYHHLVVPKHKCDNLTDTTTKQRKILQVVGWYKNQSKPGWFWFDILVVSVDWVLNILEVVPKLQRVRGWRLLGSDFCKGI